MGGGTREGVGGAKIGIFRIFVPAKADRQGINIKVSY